MLKDIRANAKKNGLVFKVDNTVSINSLTAYKFTIRESGVTVLWNYTIYTAYEDYCSGFIDSYNT